jgi:cyclohexanecarboxylate-CoA ligase
MIFPAQDQKKISRYVEHSFYHDETLSTWLLRNMQDSADSPAIISSSASINHKDLLCKVSELAAGLQSLDLGKGDVIAVQLPNTPEFIYSYLAIASIGAIMQTLHMPYRQSELEYLLNDSQAAAVICLSEFKEYSPASVALDACRSIRGNSSIISVGKNIDGIQNFRDLFLEPNKIDSELVQTDDLFVLLYTSGTTSSPKGVPHRYNNFLTNARLCGDDYGFTGSDSLLSLAPMTHLYGLFTLNMTLSLGASAVLLPVFSPDTFVKTVKEQKPSAIFAAPAHFATCFQQDLLAQKDFESVRFVCLSGSTVSPQLAEQVDDLLANGKVGQLWGMSELQAGAITRIEDPKSVRCNSSGRATTGSELRIVDSDGLLVSANKEGELQVRGLSVFDGYLNKPGETEKVFSEDAWFCTGDLAMQDEHGNLMITGRTKNLINRGGVKYNPIEIENIINKFEQVSQCAIIPNKDSTLGEIACLFVVLNKDATIELKDICAILDAANIAKFKWPEQLHIIDNMPMTPTNKIKLEDLSNLLNAVKHAE